MKNADKKTAPLKFISDRLFSLDTAFCRLYDNSLFSHLASKVRHGFLTLYTRVIGVFFFTFGIYAFLIAMLTNLFSDAVAHSSSLYGGAALAVASIPLLFSKGNVSTVLTDSNFGAVICEYLDIRQETLTTHSFSGHLNIAFILGVAAGGATVIFPLSSIVSAMVLVTVFCIIMARPEAGITFMTVLIFVSDMGLLYTVLGVTAISYAFKLIRRKRKLCLKRTDTILAIFAVSVFFGVFITEGEAVSLSSLKYFLLLFAYFLTVSLMRDRKKLLRVLYTAIMAAGILGSLYILARAFASLLPAGIFARPDLLYGYVLSLPIFSGGLAPLAFAALIPVCTSFIIKARSDGYRFTSCLCLIAMVGYLILSGELAYALAAAVATALFLFVTGSRGVYLTISALLAGSVVLAFSGSFGDRLYRYVFSRLSDAFNQARDLSYISQNAFSAEYAVCGHGFSGFADQGSNSYFTLISQLGITGFVILCFFVALILAQAASLIIKTYRSSECEEAMNRFSSLGSPAEARACALSVSCSVIVCMICATFFNFFSNPTAYLLFFMLCGFCAAYARSAKSEISSAAGSLACHQSEDRCQTRL
ncbi:MAG: hypothetical protein E7647_00965 [Ruminococcaceae bacterium]|nr:hypothetical protein [Oscillospiraceae bacterium]